jgi:hypothetical protein
VSVGVHLKAQEELDQRMEWAKNVNLRDEKILYEDRVPTNPSRLRALAGVARAPHA